MASNDKLGTALDVVTTLADSDRIHAIKLGTPNKSVTIRKDNLLGQAYGDLSVSGTPGSQALAVATFEDLTCWDAERSGLNVTASHANNKITLTNAGEYWAWAIVRATAPSAETYRFQFKWDTTLQCLYQERIMSASGDFTIEVAARWNAGVAAKDLKLQVYSAGGADLTVVDAFMSVDRVA